MSRLIGRRRPGSATPNRTKALVLLSPLLLAQAPALVPDVSEREVRIAYSFTGADLLLFGAILHARDEPLDVAVVVRGPTQSVTVREKRRVAGVWVNARSLRYRSAPSFYALASSRPIERLLDGRTRAVFELGLHSLQLSPATPAAPAEQDRFQRGLVEARRRAGLYLEDGAAVAIADRVLYRAHVGIPARVPVGRFTAETFLIRRGRVVAAAVRDIRVRKSGFERFVARAAEREPLAYGLVAVALAAGLGWFAGWAAGRR